MDWLTSIRSFVDVVELKSFSRAAEKSYASSAAISRRISWLENRAGVQLLARTTRALQLTEEGAIFYECSKKLLNDFVALTEFTKTQKKSLSGVIKITLPSSFTVFTPLNKLFTQFLQDNNEIEMQLIYSNYIQDLIADNIDIALRNVGTDIKGYEKFKISVYQIGFFASPHYLKNHKPIKKPEDLREHNCIVHQQTSFDDWHFKSMTLHVNGNLRTNSPDALTQFALHDLGVIRASEVFIKKELDQGLLVPILKSEWVKPLDVYVFYRNDVGTPYRVLALAELLRKVELT